MPYFDKLRRRIAEVNSVVCVGLDTDPSKIPDCFKQAVVAEFTGGAAGGAAIHAAISGSLDVEIMFRFNKKVIDATFEFAVVYKLNYGFYLGERGAAVLRKTVEYLRSIGALCILDFKNSDIGNSAEKYASYAYNDLNVDAVTVNPFLGHADSLDVYTRRTDKGVYVLCATSNGKDNPEGAALFQERRVMDNTTRGFSIGGPSLSLSEVVAEAVARWNTNGNCGLVVGATRPEMFEELRKRVSDVPLLIPGFGAQGGAVENAMRHGCSTGDNAVGNASREVLYGAKGEDRSQLTVEEYFEAAATAAKKWRDTFNQFRPQPEGVEP